MLFFHVLLHPLLTCPVLGIIVVKSCCFLHCLVWVFLKLSLYSICCFIYHLVSGISVCQFILMSFVCMLLYFFFFFPMRQNLDCFKHMCAFSLSCPVLCNKVWQIWPPASFLCALFHPNCCLPLFCICKLCLIVFNQIFVFASSYIVILSYIRQQCLVGLVSYCILMWLVFIIFLLWSGNFVWQFWTHAFCLCLCVTNNYIALYKALFIGSFACVMLSMCFFIHKYRSLCYNRFGHSCWLY